MGNVADTTILSWITPEVDQALETVRRSIANFLGRPDDPAPLRACPEHLHQVSGALRMVGLAGATRFCEAIERGFAALGDRAPGTDAIELIDRSVLALKEFVSDLARGQPDVPLRLYPAYRDLARLNGQADGGEQDLFFPDLSVSVPLPAQARTLPDAELRSFLQAQRGRFQRGLLAWLREKPDGVEEMRQALDALHRLAAQLPEPRGLWLASLAVLDGLTEAAGDASWLKAAKAACNRIDLYLRDLAANPAASAEALTREVLYLVAKADATSEQLKAVRQLYRLESLLPATGAMASSPQIDIQFLEVALYDLHSRLDALKSAWVRYVSGESRSTVHFRDLLASFRTKALELGNPHLTKLLDAVALVAARLPDPYPSQQQYLVIEMASAFLLMEQVVDRFTSPPEDLERQIDLMGGWLLDAEKGRSTGEPPAGLRPDLTQQIGTLHLRAQVAKQILANLQEVEQVLDGFARDPGRRDSLADLSRSLRQIHGALMVLGFERAAQALNLCERMVGACGDPGHALAERDMDWIAEGLSSLGFFLTPCLHGREPAEQALALFFSRLERARASADTAPPDITVTLQPEAASEAAPSVDPQLVAIFLEEASEVLGRIEASLPRCAVQADEQEALSTIRRGFHTLKGSGRMVGLGDLGEAAWEIEQTLNFWLEQKRPATPDLVALITSAVSSFQDWIDGLRENGQAAIDSRTLVARAQHIRTSEPAGGVGREVAIDGLALPAALFEVYAKEAREHAGTLQRELAAWSSVPHASASAEFMRAAHTLASSSRTAGFAAIADLAGAVEQWIPVSTQTPRDGAGPLHQAIGKLSAMVAAVTEQRSCGSAHSQQASLEAMTAALRRSPVVERRTTRDDLDPQLLSVFLEEAHELVPAIGAGLREWRTDPGNAEVPQSLQRVLHTLKGSARMAGALRLGELVHGIESRIETALDSGQISTGLFDALVSQADRLSADVERLRAEVAAPIGRQAQPGVPAGVPAAMLRVRADTLDHVINEAGEVAIARSRAEAELRAIRQSLADLAEGVARLRTQLREVEVQADSQVQSKLSIREDTSRDYDPLELDRYTRLQELTRLMAESANDIVAIQQSLARNAGEADAALLQQARMSRDVQQALMRMRAVPFANLNERLYRVVRQVAEELSKKAELDFDGTEVELDRSVLERIAGPLEHVLRNAVVHGIEAPATRSASGKPASGQIRLALRQESNEIVLTVADDGAGLNLEALHRQGVALGLLKPQAQPTEVELMELIFASGLSTADAISEVAGRGVGMDVVRNDIASIGGRVDVASRPGGGTIFTLHLPLTLAVTQAVLVRSGTTVLAIAAGMVEQVLRLKGEGLAELYAKGAVEAYEHAYPLHSLQQLLGGGAALEPPGDGSVLLIRSGAQRIALQVEELIGNQEIVVKSVGPQLLRVPGIAGATVLADGTVALIADPIPLAHGARSAARSSWEAVPPVPAAPASTAVVMVVDDSLTVRKVTGRLLEREGYRALAAKDGVEALEILKDTIPAAMLVDIEMPRMDGFQLTRSVRGDPRLASIPIIIVSSRTAEKHRAQAAKLGVNAFLGKPYQDAELLQQLAQCMAG